ncbi:glycosyltransferase family 2 protein [Amnibacterium kyonggiense]|uniref:Cellulose synthase/poly-beta-1,6-N-acetylglucosamine synthase-like glycosyltransferase n=1 Tax=Amnibacterium kyonggiense TaxID=595671 RepID=A0A4R7FR47_9MICO|nr:glycosyltransferase family 2 protein [Amnibacterium kyonggiense]TDS80277.1 cellulose synthase/poly-beta-1,6-N-acetylglucosamine synthase-like glycosyltransferase [Amnibacterium kyonggiense]
MPQSVTPDLLDLERLLDPPARRHVEDARIAAILPAYNEEASIGATIESLLAQTRVPDAVFVLVNNSTDETYWVAREYQGEHRRSYRDSLMTCTVTVVDMGEVPDKKVGALNYGFALAKDYDYLLGVDGDTVLDRRCVQHLTEEIVSDSRIGGVSAIYGFDQDVARTPLQRFLVRSQRFQFAGFNMDNLLRSRNMAVLGGQCSLLNVAAMKRTMIANRQDTPWVVDSEIEDSLLSLQLRSAGYRTKISASARASVGAMTTIRSLDAQQVKWNAGGVELILGNPLHPNLRLRWRENVAMLMNLASRVLFVALAAAALSIHAFEFAWWWVIPPVVSVLLAVRTATSMRGWTGRDVLYALAFVPGEAYMLLRGVHFLKAWTQVLSRSERDNWAAQARAESGQGGAGGVILAVLGGAAIAAVVGWGWLQLDAVWQHLLLTVGWTALAAVTVAQTLAMLRKLFRRHRGFTA